MTSKPHLPETLATQLLGELVAPFSPDEYRPLRVLDLGPASGASVAFFSQYRCTLRFADLNPGQLNPSGEHDNDQERQHFLENQLRPMIDLPVGSKFDICLMWDMLNHLDGQGVRALANVLRPHLHSASRCHGYVLHNRGAELFHRNYAILGVNQLMVTAVHKGWPLGHCHSQVVLNNLFGGMAVKRSVLRGDGRLEVLLART